MPIPLIKRIGWMPILIAGFLLIALLGTLLTQQSEPSKPELGGNFTLQSSHGAVSLSDYKGKVVVMMFGFTRCPDICPTGLATLAATFNLLTEEQLNQVQGLFISVDPERDSPERLAKFTHYFHPRIQGITGDKTSIDRTVKLYGAFYRMVDLPDSALKYTVDHSSRVYIIDQNGKLYEMKYHNTAPQEMAEAIKALL